MFCDYFDIEFANLFNDVVPASCLSIPFRLLISSNAPMQSRIWRPMQACIGHTRSMRPALFDREDTSVAPMHMYRDDALTAL
eukprot:m.681943 g.681943  ORF g.681943 m.681943 type:complete len:82 (+) comp22815_c0_seq8:3021-3266(+)